MKAKVTAVKITSGMSYETKRSMLRWLDKTVRIYDNGGKLLAERKDDIYYITLAEYLEYVEVIG